MFRPTGDSNMPRNAVMHEKTKEDEDCKRVNMYANKGFIMFQFMHSTCLSDPSRIQIMYQCYSLE